MVISKDKKRFYLTNSLEDVEIIDIATSQEHRPLLDVGRAQ